jgi:aminoglycoside phosphotransferase (APT) family kinase protein
MPLMDAVRSRERILELFNERVVPHVYPGHRLKKLSAERMTYSPGERCMVLYKYKLKPALAPKRAAPRFALLTLTANGAADAEYRRHYGANELLPVVSLPDVGALIEFFPMDWSLPGLRFATDVARMQPVLDAAAGTRSGATDWSYAVRRYHPRVRCVLEYRGTDVGEGATVASATDGFGPANRRVIGKTYARGAKASHVWSVLESVNALAGGSFWRTPRPLAYERESNLILLEYMDGKPIADLLCEEAPQREQCIEAVRTAARVLVELHRVPVTGFAVRTSEEGRRKTSWRSSRLEGLDPQLAKRITALLQQIADRCAQFPCSATTFVHGSPSPKQFLVDGDRVSLLDFDGARLGDPAADLGVFLASLSKYELKASDPAVLAGLGDSFLEEYRRAGGDGSIGRRARLIQCQELTGYAARNFLRKAHKYDAGKQAQKPMRFLDEATACLASL